MEIQQAQSPIAQQVTEETQAIAPQVTEEKAIASQVRVTKNLRKATTGRKGGLVRKTKAHISNTEPHSTIKTLAPYVLGIVAIAVVRFFETGEQKTPIAQSTIAQAPQNEVQLELSPHVVL